ncbi:MAG: putative Ig domain-containing protein [Leptospira sp.]|nr:putative Ig domain-containing protein [Leptospira sp.]
MQFKFPYMFRVFLICVLLGCSIQCVPKENNKEDDKKNDLIIFSLLFSSSAKIDSISPELVFENSKITITGSRFIQSGIQKILIDSKFEVIPDSITETEITARIPSGLIWSGLIPVSLRGTNFQDVKRIHFEKNLNYAKNFMALEVNVTNASNPVIFISGPKKENLDQLSFGSDSVLPQGLVMNPSNGHISGIPTATTSGVISYPMYATHSSNPEVKLKGTLNLLVVTGAEKTNRTCNTIGIAPGCSAVFPYSCSISDTCFRFNSDCSGNTKCGF